MAIQAVNQALAVSGQDASHVPFVNSSGVIANDPTNFSYSPSTQALTVKNLTIPSGGALTIASGGNSTLYQKMPVLPSSGNTTLSAAMSGATMLFDAAAGITFTLPAPAVGLWFDFVVTVSCTSAGHKVITNTGTVLLAGLIAGGLNNTANKQWVADGSTHVSANMTAAASNAAGGIIGSYLRFVCATTTLWIVTGTVVQGGTPVTPFATS